MWEHTNLCLQGATNLPTRYPNFSVCFEGFEGIIKKSVLPIFKMGKYHTIINQSNQNDTENLSLQKVIRNYFKIKTNIPICKKNII